MINNSDFARRLKEIMEYYQISASAFADKIKVQRSSISHLLSGRNKPSLDFVLKVVKEYKDVELYWLLNGKGKFPSENIASPTGNITSSEILQDSISSNMTEADFDPGQQQTQKKIERIVIFYKDGTFKEYMNRS